MILGFRTDRAGILVLLTLALGALLVLLLLGAIWGQQSAYKSRAADLGPRIARMQGLVEHREMLREAAHLADQALLDLTYPAAEDTQTTATAMQQQVRGVMEAAGLDVTGSQILPASNEEHFTRIRLDLTARGGMDALEAALLGLDGEQPLMLVESLNIQPVRTRRRGDNTQHVVARFRLVSLRLLP